jgi:Family of unknown function (DUF6011)
MMTMAGGTAGAGEARELMEQIARLAPLKRHTLARYMVDGSRPLTVPQAQMVIEHLGKCDDMPGAARQQAPEVSAAVATRHEEPRQAADPQGEQRLPGLASFRDIPAGFYATPSGAGGDILDFWKVRKPKKGKWEGFAFPVRVLGGGSGSELRTVDLSNIQQRRALLAIRAAGIESAAREFADKLQRCMDCGLPLTDAVSRAARKGPTCRSKSG